MGTTLSCLTPLTPHRACAVRVGSGWRTGGCGLCVGLLWACVGLWLEGNIPEHGSIAGFAAAICPPGALPCRAELLCCCLACDRDGRESESSCSCFCTCPTGPPSYPEPSQVGRLVGEAGHLFSCILQRPLQLHFWSSVQNSDDAQGINLPCDGVLVGHVGHVPYRSGQLEFHVYTDICRSQLCSTPLTLCTPHSSTSQPIQPG